MEPLWGETWVGGCRVSCVCIVSGAECQRHPRAGTGKVWTVSGVLTSPPGAREKITEKEYLVEKRKIVEKGRILELQGFAGSVAR